MSFDLTIIPHKDWFPSNNHPIIIAGPCSAESQEQLLLTAHQLSATKSASVLRAGIWKPRTRPDVFEGVGEKGLLWMAEAKAQTGLLTAVEIASPKHLELCLKHGIDMVWIGARTTVNPFSVQEIAQALKGVDIPVLIKNPLHPDLKLWIGAIERINLAGVNKIMAVHRGFFTYEKTVYRNIPLWEVPIELKRLFPNLPILCDPSHISGKRELLFSVAQEAMDLAMDGLMIEVHCDPENAKTDAAQQITPKDLEVLLAKIIKREAQAGKGCIDKLDLLRHEVDKIDYDLLKILAKRMDIIREIGVYKKEQNLTVLQIERLRLMIQDRLSFGSTIQLDNRFILKLLQMVHNESIRIQTDMMNTRDLE